MICGYNNIALGKKVTADKNKLIQLHGWNNVKVFTFDGSTHDSH